MSNEIPKVVKEFVKKWGKTIGVAGDIVGVISFGIKLAEYAGLMKSDVEKVKLELLELSAQIEKSTQQIIARIDQAEEVNLIGAVNAQLKNLADFRTASESIGPSLAANILTSLNESEAKLRIAMQHAAENRNFERALTLSKLQIDNWIYRSALKAMDESRSTQCLPSLSINVDLLIAFVEDSLVFFGKCIRSQLMLRMESEINWEHGNVRENYIIFYHAGDQRITCREGSGPVNDLGAKSYFENEKLQHEEKLKRLIAESDFTLLLNRLKFSQNRGKTAVAMRKIDSNIQGWHGDIDLEPGIYVVLPALDSRWAISGGASGVHDYGFQGNGEFDGTTIGVPLNPMRLGGLAGVLWVAGSGVEVFQFPKDKNQHVLAVPPQGGKLQFIIGDLAGCYSDNHGECIVSVFQA